MKMRMEGKKRITKKTRVKEVEKELGSQTPVDDKADVANCVGRKWM